MQYCEKTDSNDNIISPVFVQFYSNRELEDQLTKIREVLSDDKHDWEHRVVAVRIQMHTHTG